MSKRCAWALAALTVVLMPASAQDAGQIVGAVRDPSGGAIPNVTVTATETGTGFASSVKTGTEGQFVFQSLRPTNYEISAEASAFRRLRKSAAVLQANQNLNATITLEICALTET